jgi:hypothetical protein
MDGRQTDCQTGMTKPIVACRNFANAPKNFKCSNSVNLLVFFHSFRIMRIDSLRNYAHKWNNHIHKYNVICIIHCIQTETSSLEFSLRVQWIVTILSFSDKSQKCQISRISVHYNCIWAARTDMNIHVHISYWERVLCPHRFFAFCVLYTSTAVGTFLELSLYYHWTLEDAGVW